MGTVFSPVALGDIMELSIDIERGHNPDNLPIKNIRHPLVALVAGKQLIHKAQQISTWLLFPWVDASEEHHFLVFNILC